MSRLANIRGGLSSLRLARQGLRWSLALAALVVAVLAALLVAFAIDVGFAACGVYTTAPQRAILLLLAVGVCAWAFLRFSWPLLTVQETDLEMALWVERQQGIDSDLVAALQFESAQAPQWGSPTLQAAVIDYVAEWGRGLDVFAGFDRSQLAQRLGLLAILAGVAAVVTMVSPGHVTTFLARLLLLRPDHYPSATKVEGVVVNGSSVSQPARAGGAEIDYTQLRRVASPFGQPVTFEVQTFGQAPDQARVRFLSAESGVVADVPLEKAPLEKVSPEKAGPENAAPENGANEQPSSDAGRQRLVGRLPRLLDSLTYQLYVGDAWTDPAAIDVVPLPVVRPVVEVVPPAYARRAAENEDPALLQRAVLEGSTVRLSLDAVTKPLRWARATFIGRPDNVVVDLKPPAAGTSPVDGEQGRWTLDVTDTPLARVLEPVRLEIQVEDLDGLRLERPLAGLIRIKADRKPQVTAEVVNRLWVPDATPEIRLRLRDDYGIRALRLHLRITRAAKQRERLEMALAGNVESASDGAPAESVPSDTEDVTLEIVRLEPSRHERESNAARNGAVRGGMIEQTTPLPLLADVLPLEGCYTLPLAGYNLEKGDQLNLTFEAIDERGDLPGESSSSETLALEITDVSGVLAAIAEGDERSEKSLTDTINLQLGIGEAK